MRAGKLGQHLGQDTGADVIRGAQPHGAFQLRGGEVADGLLVQFQQASGVAEHGLALGGEADPTRFAEEQPLPHLFLQPLDLHAQGRGGAEHFGGGLGKAFRLRDSHEAAQDFRVQEGLKRAVRGHVSPFRKIER